MSNQMPIGSKWGKWEVTGLPWSDENYKKFYPVTCECGMIDNKRAWDLRNGTSTQCRWCRETSKCPDIVGQQFGEWEVLSKADSDWQQRSQFLCRCSCGAEHVVRVSNLLNGRSTRCKACGYLCR